VSNAGVTRNPGDTQSISSAVDYTALDGGQVTTAAGTFDTVEVDTRSDQSSKTLWWAFGVGLVRADDVELSDATP
jgi:hypothetical protein